MRARKRCTHRHDVQFAYGLHDDEYIEWCPVCGAFRRTNNALERKRANWVLPKREKP